MRRPRVQAVALAVLAIAPIVGAGAATPPPPSDVAQIPVVIRFTDQPVAQVLEALFSATGAHGVVDPCVGGRVSISLENVTLGVALDSLARIADLDIRRIGGGDMFHVTCLDVEERRAGRRAMRTGADTVTLEFRLEQMDADGRSEVRAQPRLVARIGEPAEISEPGNAPDYALEDDGAVAVRSRKPSWRVEAVVVPGRGGGPPEIRGLIEISEAPHGPEGMVVTRTQPFRAPLTGAEEMRLAEVRECGSTWTLTLAGLR